MWSILLLTLPTQPNSVRLRIWRALKALGCATLRDGVFVLPESQVASLEQLATEVRDHGGSASIMTLTPRDDEQRAEILAQFDRTGAYGQWRATATALQHEFPTLSETDARRRLRAVADALLSVRRIDYYPTVAAEQAEADLVDLRRAFDAVFSEGEPQARADDGIDKLDPGKFQGKRWATRARPWVDRLACAWLIRRFIDPQATFLWLGDPSRPPRGAIGFDFDGARFTHVGTRVTFEVMAASFSLDDDSRLQRLARVVHYLDVGGIPAPEAPGLEAVLGGLREIHDDDDRLVEAAAAVFDALYAAPGASA